MAKKRYRLTYGEFCKWQRPLSIFPDSELNTSPVPTHYVPGILRGMGIEASENTLIRLPRDTGGEFPTGSRGRKPKWTPELIDLAAKILEDWGRLTPLAGFLMENGLTLRDYYTALESAQKAALEKYGPVAASVLKTPIDSDDYKMILCPPRKLGKPSIYFELQESTLAEIEAARKARKG